MATWSDWVYPEQYKIIGTTKIKDADNYIQAGQNDIQYWVNGTGDYTDTGLKVYVNDSLTELFSSFVEDTVIVEW